MKVACLVILILSSTCLTAQSSTILSQSELLSSFELEFLSPVEQNVSSVGAGKLGFFIYQMGVEIDNGSSLALVGFDPMGTTASPHILMPAKVATLASNDQDVDIRIQGATAPDGSILNADWVCHAYFVPKSGTGRYAYGKLTAMYREGIGLVYVYYLSRDEWFPYGELFQFMDLE